MLEIVNYQEEFRNQDEFSVQALSAYLENVQREASIPKETVSSMLEYSKKIQDDLLNYSLSRWWDEIASEIILEEMIGEVLTTKANAILLVWDLASNYIPVLSSGLSAAEKFELTLYASAFQYGAFDNSRNCRTQLFLDESDITAENLYKLAQYYYIYLKSCFISREAALGSLAGKMEIDSYKEKIQPLIDWQNDINTDIAEMLVKLKNAKATNEQLVYGFLPSDNEKYLKNYNSDCLIRVCYESNRYKAYAEKVELYEDTYGYAEIIRESEYYSYMTGLCFLRLVDFANDGKEELLLVYRDNEDNYIFEIWEYSDRQIVLLDSGQLYTLDGGSRYIYLVERYGYIYLVTNSMNQPGHFYYHGYNDNKFGIVREENKESIYFGGEECFINGELVSYETFQKEHEEWLNNELIYNINYEYSGCIEVIQQNNDTKRQFGSFYFGKIEDITILSEDEIYTIAEEYWGIQKGSIDTETGFLMDIFVYDQEYFELTENMEYRVDLRWLVDNRHWSNLDSIYINAISRECRPYY